jgi:8-oxo-dGTP diphosphatase
MWTAKNSEGYASPVGLAIDVVLLSVRTSDLSVVLLRRGDGEHVLPGGFVLETETAEEAVERQLRNKVGVGIPGRLEQLETFTDPRRDPRGWIPSVAYLALVPPETEISVDEALWGSLSRGVPHLGYDHSGILALALKRIRGKLWWSNIAGGILDKPFTMTTAREVYEAIAGKQYDPSTFARDLNATKLIEPTGEHVMTPRGRPAALYRFISDQPMWGAGRRKRVDGEPSLSS